MKTFISVRWFDTRTVIGVRWFDTEYNAWLETMTRKHEFVGGDESGCDAVI